MLEHIGDRFFTDERCKKILQDIVEETGLLRQRTAEHRKQLKNELEDVEKRLLRWQEAFETEQLPRDFDTERVTQLHQRREEIQETLAKIVPLRSPPPCLYTQATIARFRETIREIFMAEDCTTARNYLRFLIDEIVITDESVQIFVKSDAAFRMMAEPSPSGVLTAEGQVRTTVVDWLPLVGTFRTFCVAPPPDVRVVFEQVRLLAA